MSRVAGALASVRTHSLRQLDGENLRMCVMCIWGGSCQDYFLIHWQVGIF